MTDTVPGVTTAGPILVSGADVPFHRAQPCPPGRDCGDPFASPAPRRERESYKPSQLTNGEAAILVQARLDAEHNLRGAVPDLDDAAREAGAARETMRVAQQQLSMFVELGAVRHAAAAVERVRRRHENDGPVDRRYRPSWMTWMLVAALVAASVYDAAFFGAVFQKLLNLPEGWSWEKVASYLPGLLIAVALLATGHWLAEALLRCRERAARAETRPTWWPFRRERPTRLPDELPWDRWGLPLSALTLVVGTLGVWAIIRGAPVEQQSPSPYHYAALLLLFTFAALAATILHHNPFLDSATTADKALDRSRQNGESCLTACADATAGYAAAIHRFRARVESWARETEQTMQRAWISILQERDAHGRATEFAPAFAAGQADPAEPGRPLSLFELPKEPMPPLTLLTTYRRWLDDHDDVRAATAFLDTMGARLSEQVGSVGDDGSSERARDVVVPGQGSAPAAESSERSETLS